MRTPRYRQIADALRTRILAGEFAAGFELVVERLQNTGRPRPRVDISDHTQRIAAA